MICRPKMRLTLGALAALGALGMDLIIVNPTVADKV